MSGVAGGRPRAVSLGPLSAVAMLANLACGVGSVGLMLRASHHTPQLLRVMFLLWVASPFVALAWAQRSAHAWPASARAALAGVTFVIALGSLAVYAHFVLPPASAPRATAFLLVPAGSWLLTGLAVLFLRRASATRPRGDGTD